MTAAAPEFAPRIARPRLNWRAIWLLGVPTALLLGLFYSPMAAFLALGVVDAEGDLTLAHLQRLMEGQVYLRVLGYSLWFSFAATVWTLLLGYPVAYLMARLKGRLLLLLLVAMVVPLFTSNLIRSYAWVAILGQEGVANAGLMALGLGRQQLLYNEFALYVATIHIDLPFMVLTLYGVMTQIDRRYEQAAATLGAGFIRRFIRVYFPLTLPGVMAGSLLVFALTIGSFVTPALVAGTGQTLIAVLINQQISSLLNWHVGAALSLLLVAATAAAFLAQMRSARFEA